MFQLRSCRQRYRVATDSLNSTRSATSPITSLSASNNLWMKPSRLGSRCTLLHLQGTSAPLREKTETKQPIQSLVASRKRYTADRRSQGDRRSIELRWRGWQQSRYTRGTQWAADDLGQSATQSYNQCVRSVSFVSDSAFRMSVRSHPSGERTLSTARMVFAS